MFGKFKSLDVYRSLPKDLTEQTVTGASVSVCCTIVIVWLFFAELATFMTPEITQEMFVDRPRSGESDMLQINMKIDFPNLPCAVIGLDVQDVMGTHTVDVGGKLLKTRLDDEGFVKTNVYGAKLPDVQDDEQAEVNGAEQRGEGCRLHGFFAVKKVPGNFHISAHAKSSLTTQFFDKTPMNVSHTIHDLWFGSSEELHTVEKATVNPLRGTAKSALPSVEDKSPISYEYYIKIVPTSYQKRSGQVTHNYQFVSNSNQLAGRYRVPAVYFRYDLSPIVVQLTETNKLLSHFLVQVCAIVGGVFTVLGVVNSVIHSSIKAVIMSNKKNQIGKLG